MNTQEAGQFYGYDVIDSTGKKIGTVDGVWVDDATSQLEFIGVKTGWLMGKTHVVPMANAQIGEGSAQVPYPEDQIRDAPSFGSDDELTPDQEDQIYGYYGIDRSTAPSPTGLPGGTGVSTDSMIDAGAGSDIDTGYTRDTVDAGEEERVRLHEEELQVGKRQVEAGRVRLRKVVHTEQQQVPVELRREEVDIERVPVAEGEVAPDAFQEGEIDVPVMREEPVVGKEARVTGEVRVGKDVETETRTVGDQVRREEVEVDRDDDTTLEDDTTRRRGI